MSAGVTGCVSFFLINYSDKKKTVTLDGEWEDTIAGETVHEAIIPPVDLAILKKDL